ncbi:endolytic transglycosylase MltG [uncultured Secundilactobacillus sp.]|uniref:endolytic transglycosylase MltG n=1 Tax=uncultured Secundilactobacillus sp. TaxID=2813935 RepID=UPI0025874BE3|nr:endolytic transglycosylase MltG [uncultured Secundilactobacillus sp.]
MDNGNEPTSRQTNAPKKPSTGRKIIIGVVSVLVLLVVAIGIAFYQYFQSALKPLNPNSNEVVQVDIPMGASNKKIGSILQDDKIVKSGMVFNYYVKSHNFSDFRAGYYQLKPSMTLNQIAKELQKGGSSEPIQSQRGKVLIQEGATVENVADTISSQTDFSRSEFINLMKNQSYMKQLAAKYPKLLKSTMAGKDVRYRLEGYLYPATYTVSKNMSLKRLVDSMVAQTNVELAPYFKTISKKHMTIQQVLTLSSLVEREGVTTKDRRKIAGVFLNRIAANMPLQSDISVLYAINKHKKNLSMKDLQSNSPYNLYKNAGYGPGPFNNPSLDSIKAVLNPSERSEGYLYFVANTKTGKIYYSKTLDEHNQKAGNLQSVNGD